MKACLAGPILTPPPASIAGMYRYRDGPCSASTRFIDDWVIEIDTVRGWRVLRSFRDVEMPAVSRRPAAWG